MHLRGRLAVLSLGLGACTSESTPLWVGDIADPVVAVEVGADDGIRRARILAAERTTELELTAGESVLLVSLPQDRFVGGAGEAVRWSSIALAGAAGAEPSGVGECGRCTSPLGTQPRIVSDGSVCGLPAELPRRRWRVQDGEYLVDSDDQDDRRFVDKLTLSAPGACSCGSPTSMLSAPRTELVPGPATPLPWSVGAVAIGHRGTAVVVGQDRLLVTTASSTMQRSWPMAWPGVVRAAALDGDAVWVFVTSGFGGDERYVVARVDIGAETPQMELREAVDSPRLPRGRRARVVWASSARSAFVLELESDVVLECDFTLTTPCRRVGIDQCANTREVGQQFDLREVGGEVYLAASSGLYRRVGASFACVLSSGQILPPDYDVAVQALDEADGRLSFCGVATDSRRRDVWVLARGRPDGTWETATSTAVVDGHCVGFDWNTRAIDWMSSYAELTRTPERGVVVQRAGRYTLSVRGGFDDPSQVLVSDSNGRATSVLGGTPTGSQIFPVVAASTGEAWLVPATLELGSATFGLQALRESGPGWERVVEVFTDVPPALASVPVCGASVDPTGRRLVVVDCASGAVEVDLSLRSVRRIVERVTFTAAQSLVDRHVLAGENVVRVVPFDGGPMLVERAPSSLRPQLSATTNTVWMLDLIAGGVWQLDAYQKTPIATLVTTIDELTKDSRAGGRVLGTCARAATLAFESRWYDVQPMPSGVSLSGTSPPSALRNDGYGRTPPLLTELGGEALALSTRSHVISGRTLALGRVPLHPRTFVAWGDRRVIVGGAHDRVAVVELR